MSVLRAANSQTARSSHPRCLAGIAPEGCTAESGGLEVEGTGSEARNRNLQWSRCIMPGDTSCRSIRRHFFFQPTIYESDDRHFHCHSGRRLKNPVSRLAGGSHLTSPHYPILTLPPVFLWTGSKPAFYETSASSAVLAES